MSREWKRTFAAAAILCVAVIYGFTAARNGASATQLPLTGRAGSTFRPEPAPSGMISQQQAVAVALHHSEGAVGGRLLPGVQMRAYFGIYTDTIFAERPVWIVYFWGPGLVIYGDGGPPPPGTPYCAPPTAHAEFEVIDGKTGRWLEGDVGNIPEGIPIPVVTPLPAPTPCPTRPSDAMTPWSVAVGGRGNLFLAGPGYGFTGVVQKRSPAGQLLHAWATSGPHENGYQIIHIALDAHGNVYVANDDNLIQKYSPAGRLLWAWYPEGHALPQTYGWWTVSVAPNGIAYAASTYRGPIDVLSPTGRVIGRRPGHWNYLAVDRHGTLYAANVRRGLVTAFSSTGRRLRHWLIETSPGVGTILGLSAAGDGSVYVLERRDRIVHPAYEVARFSPAGGLLERFQISEGPGAHQILEPRDLAVGGRGTIFIADSGNPRISAFSPSGRFLASWQL